MIKRYTTKEMKRIWSDENRYRKWLEVEVAIVEGWAIVGKISEGDVEFIRKNASFTVEGIENRERVLHHDVAAFVDEISEYLGDRGRYIHYGITSSDILDTSLALILREVSDVLLEEIGKLLSVLKEKALKYKYTPIIGRTHGIHAEPTTLGLKLLSFYAELKRNRERLVSAFNGVFVGKISGAVGNYANVPPEVEGYVLGKLGLNKEDVATQVVARDRHAFLFGALSLLAAGLERIALQVRLLSRMDTFELQEPFGRGQKGSSAMPHKRNPVRSERICGMSRLLRGYFIPMVEDISLWDERDMSHSSVERVALADATTLVHFMLKEMNRIIDGLVVREDRMFENIWLTKGLVFSQRVMLELIDRGMSRKDAYALVQSAAADVWDNGLEFIDALKKRLDFDPSYLFNIDYYTRYVDRIFDSLLREGG